MFLLGGGGRPERLEFWIDLLVGWVSTTYNRRIRAHPGLLRWGHYNFKTFYLSAFDLGFQYLVNVSFFNIWVALGSLQLPLFWWSGSKLSKFWLMHKFGLPAWFWKKMMVMLGFAYILPFFLIYAILQLFFVCHKTKTTLYAM